MFLARHYFNKSCRLSRECFLDRRILQEKKNRQKTLWVFCQGSVNPDSWIPTFGSVNGVSSILTQSGFWVRSVLSILLIGGLVGKGVGMGAFGPTAVSDFSVFAAVLVTFPVVGVVFPTTSQTATSTTTNTMISLVFLSSMSHTPS